MDLPRMTFAIRRTRPAAASLALAAAILLPAVSADAQSRRPDTRQMTCAQVQDLINSRGGVVLSTGQRTFDRYVAHGGFCLSTEIAVRERIRTRDTKSCRVRTCEDRNFFRFRNR